MAGRGHDVTLYSMPDDKDAHGEIDGAVKVTYLRVSGERNGAGKNAAEMKGYLDSGGFSAVVAIDMSSYGFMAAKAKAARVLLVSTGIDIYRAAASGKKSMIVKSVRHADGVLAAAPNIITKIKEYFRKDKAYFVAPFGVDMERFRKRDAERPDGVCFGSLKQLEAWNGVDLVLEAFAKYRKQVEAPARLRVVGDGPCRPELESKAAALGVADSVEFTGYVKNADMPDMINTMDVVVQMTREESFGVSGVEAMACETPLVASDTYGASEYILNGVTGYLVKAGNTDACAGKMAEAVKNPQARKTMGGMAREDVYAQYGLPGCIEKFEAAVKSVAG
jgi:glycosyltransferase involved in cell wall biosynthesis